MATGAGISGGAAIASEVKKRREQRQARKRKDEEGLRVKVDRNVEPAVRQAYAAAVATPSRSMRCSATSATPNPGGIDPAATRAFLTAPADHTSARDAVGLADLADVTIVMGAWLLSASLPDGKDRTGFLDEILDALDAAPA